jgi:hypothetical protein
MKKIFLVLLVVFVSFNSYSMSHKPFMDLSFNSFMAGNEFQKMWFFDFSVGYKLKYKLFKLDLYGNFKSYWITESKTSVYPYHNIASIEGRLYFSKVYIQVKYSYGFSTFDYNSPILNEKEYPFITDGHKTVISAGIYLD